LWSVDLFRCESAILRAHWVLVVMDQFTRRIVGFGVHRGAVDGVGLCRMFNRATRGHTPPTYLSSDHDRLYLFHQWQANLRILDVEAIKRIGEVVVGLEDLRGRCIMTTFDPDTLAHDRRVLTSIGERFGASWRSMLPSFDED
jgi:hypothetical protein